jgi:DNA polymerase I
MSLILGSGFGLSEGTFSAFIAPADDLELALGDLLRRERGLVLYLCGNYPQILPGLNRFSQKFSVRRALTVFQILEILDDSHHSFLIFEHDRTLYDDQADLLPIIGNKCREQAETTRGILLIAPKPDRYISALEPFFHRLVYFRNITETKKVNKPEIRTLQQTLF